MNLFILSSLNCPSPSCSIMKIKGWLFLNSLGVISLGNGKVELPLMPPFYRTKSRQPVAVCYCVLFPGKNEVYLI